MGERRTAVRPIDPYARTIGTHPGDDGDTTDRLPSTPLPPDVADWVIQRVFRATLRLAAVQSSVPPPAQEGVDDAIRVLDSLIHDVRLIVATDRPTKIG